MRVARNKERGRGRTVPAAGQRRPWKVRRRSLVHSSGISQGGDEVAAVVVDGEVDVVVPLRAVAGAEVFDALGGADAGWVLIADESDAGGGLHDRRTIVGRRPGVA